MQDNHKCIAIKSSDGLRCSKRATTDRRCGVHNAIVLKEGPNHVELLEVAYPYKAQRKALTKQYNESVEALGDQPWLNARDDYIRLNRTYGERNRILFQQEREEYNIVRQRQQEDIDRTGINPDAVQDARREAQRQQALARHNERLAALQRHQERRLVEREREIQQRNVEIQRQVDQRPLANFANDRQNVHTTAAVKQTLKIINELLKIEVPEEYRWNMRTVSKTMSEIISECNLSPASAWQMVSKYCSDETIYDLVPGVYGKVLDCVWQYIKTSPDKEDLKRILTSEMKDNIGMCAQGNLSRLTNILAGYLDCVVVEESIVDQLGRLLPPLMNIENIPMRLIAATNIFKQIGLPQNQWEGWVHGLLMDQDDDDYREVYIHDERIDFIVFT
jgi:hypothetical protein